MNAHSDVAAGGGGMPIWRSKVQHLILRGASHPLAARFIPSFNHCISNFSQMT